MTCSRITTVDLGNRRGRRVTSSGVVTTLAGSGLVGSADGTGTVATFYSPFSVALDGSGNTLVVDATTHNIRRVTPAGVVTTVAGGSGASALDGAALVARFYAPRGIAVDSSGTVLVADTGNSLIRRLASGQVSTLAGAFGVGYADGDARVARFNQPLGIVAHSSGHYVIDRSNHVIRNVARSGLVTTLAGRAGVLGVADGAAAVATFNYPFMGTLEANGNLLVADVNNHRIRRVTPTGNVTTIGTLVWWSSSLDGSEATARFDTPIALATAPDGNVYLSERGVSNRIRRLATGNVTTVAGRLHYLDGTGLNARFNAPYSVAVDLAGNVYVADTSNHRIRKMSPAGDVTTVAGTGVPGFADGPAGTAMFKFPLGIDVDASGNLYVADTENNRIRVVSTSGVVSTLAGSSNGFLDGAGRA
jgi:sugar lactone lactonase YvrE